MSHIPVELVIAVFENEQAASQALETLNRLHKEQLVEIGDAAVVRRDAHDKVHIHQTMDVTGGRGAAVGGVLGAVLGLIAGPPGIVVGGAVGAIVGGAAARVIDTGIPDRRLRELGATLSPGTSAIVAILEHTWVAEVKDRLAQAGGTVEAEPLNQSVARELRAERDATLSALNLGEALADGGMVPVDDQGSGTPRP
jgi:uncharacterized membrane protein